MLIAITSSLATIACHGCVSVGQSYSSVAAAPQSEAMMLAIPGQLGSGALNAPSADVLSLGKVTVYSSPRPAFHAVTSTGREVGTGATFALTDGQTAFGLTSRADGSGQFDSQSLNWTSSDALTAVAGNVAAARYGQPIEVSTDVSLGIDLAASSAKTGLGFDVGLAPRFGARRDGDLSSRRFGGEVRVGQGLSSLVDDSGKPEGWYVFVGADGEALVWDTDTSLLRGSMGDLMVTDQVTVGDLQAGLSVQRRGGELSLSYIRREIKFDDRNRSMRDTEDFAGLTFTMRR